MRSFCAGFFIPLLVLLVWGLQQDPQQPWARAEPARLAALLVLLPLACAYAGAKLALLARPRRLFDARMRGGALRRGLVGAGAGTIAVVCTGGLLILLDRWVPDWALVTGSATVCGALGVLPLSRVRAGVCFFCGYDLSAPAAPGQAGFGLCPECGADCIGERPAVRRAPAVTSASAARSAAAA